MARVHAQSGGEPAFTTSNGALRALRSRYYNVQTDMPEWAARQVADYMDSVFAAYSQRFAKFPVRSTAAPPLYLFANRQDYLAFLAAQGINGNNTGGIYFRLGGRSGLVGFVESRNREKVFSTLRHEAFHQFMSERLGLRLPKWLNEGLATYFEEGVVGKNEIVTGLVPRQRLRQLHRDIQQNALQPFDVLFNAASSDWSQVVRADSTTASSVYNQSWALIQFFIHSEGGKYVPAFEKFFQRVGLGEPAPAAFRATFGLNSPTELQDEWLDYVRNLEPDPLSLAIEELKPLANGLQVLHTQGVGIKTVPQLYVALQRFAVPHVPADNSAFGRVPGLTLRLAAPTNPQLPPDLVANDGQNTIRVGWYLSQQGTPEPELTAGIA